MTDPLSSRGEDVARGLVTMHSARSSSGQSRFDLNARGGNTRSTESFPAFCSSARCRVSRCMPARYACWKNRTDTLGKSASGEDLLDRSVEQFTCRITERYQGMT